MMMMMMTTIRKKQTAEILHKSPFDDINLMRYLLWIQFGGIRTQLSHSI